MLVLVVYDISTATAEDERRLRRVAQACEDYGQRVQKSVFECRVGPAQWASLRDRLTTTMDPKEDSLRFYFLEEDTRIEHQGAGRPIDLQGPLIV